MDLAAQALTPIPTNHGCCRISDYKIHITRLQDEVTVRLNNNRAILRSGVITCELGVTHSVDVEGGDTYWKPVPTEGTCALSN